MKKKVMWVVAFGSICVSIAFILPITHKDAENTAIEEFNQYAREYKIDTKVFKGPIWVKNKKYSRTFQWETVDESGPFRLMVSVPIFGSPVVWSPDPNPERFDDQK